MAVFPDSALCRGAAPPLRVLVCLCMDCCLSTASSAMRTRLSFAHSSLAARRPSAFCPTPCLAASAFRLMPVSRYSVCTLCQSVPTRLFTSCCYVFMHECDRRPSDAPAMVKRTSAAAARKTSLLPRCLRIITPYPFPIHAKNASGWNRQRPCPAAVTLPVPSKNAIGEVSPNEGYRSGRSGRACARWGGGCPPMAWRI